MSPNDPPTRPDEPIASDSDSSDSAGDVAGGTWLPRRSVLRGAAAAGLSGALLGATGAASAHDDKRRLVVKARTDVAKYRIEVDGEIWKGPNSGETDHIEDEATAVGKLSAKGEIDDFWFTGSVTDFEVKKGDVAVWVDGEEVDPDDFGEAEEHEIAIQAEGPHVDYEFVVDGAVEPGDEADIGVGDHIDDGVVTGTIAGSGVDNYLFTGELTKFQIPRRAPSDEATVRLDGEEVDIDELGEFSYVSIHAEGPHVDYEFAVDGAVEPAAEADIGVGDHIDDGVVTGNVAGSHGFDNYWFTGELTAFEVSRDDVLVRVDGEEIEPDGMH